MKCSLFHSERNCTKNLLTQMGKMLCRIQHIETDLGVSKLVLTRKTRDVPNHWQSLKTKNWSHFLIKIYQELVEIIASRYFNSFRTFQIICNDSNMNIQTLNDLFSCVNCCFNVTTKQQKLSLRETSQWNTLWFIWFWRKYKLSAERERTQVFVAVFSHSQVV